MPIDNSQANTAAVQKRYPGLGGRDDNDIRKKRLSQAKSIK